jgi:hypothetical protein
VRLAVEKNDLDIVQLLLAVGANPLIYYNAYLYQDQDQVLMDCVADYKYADWSPMHEGTALASLSAAIAAVTPAITHQSIRHYYYLLCSSLSSLAHSQQLLTF